jgi:hypothetical protein
MEAKQSLARWLSRPHLEHRGASAAAGASHRVSPVAMFLKQKLPLDVGCFSQNAGRGRGDPVLLTAAEGAYSSAGQVRRWAASQKASDGINQTLIVVTNNIFTVAIASYF